MIRLYETLQTWLDNGVFGAYRSCEVTTCGLLSKDDVMHNLFTILCFEPRAVSKTRAEYLTKRNEVCGKDFHLVVMRYQTSLAAALAVCKDLEAGGRELVTPEGAVSVGALTPVPPMFVPTDSTQILPINRLLKNNFRGGSMACEYFSEKKPFTRTLEQGPLQSALLRIQELVPIDLFTVAERVESVIFQLPEQIASCNLTGTADGICCTVTLDKRVRHPERYCLSMYTEYDHAMMGFASVQGNGAHTLSLTQPDTGGPYHILLTDTERHVPILQQTTSMMRDIHSTLVFAGNADSIRTVKTSAGLTEEITINSGENLSVTSPALPWEEGLTHRRYRERMKVLERRREFLRYGKGVSERERALRDLRALMNAKAKTEVCLWDPYLSAADLLETWYFTETYGLSLKAITSHSACQKDEVDVWKQVQREALRDGSNQYGVNLQLRIQHSGFGYGFHDRFLITTEPGGQPMAWSLGTSLNSLGKKHHILQLVSNPGYIADAFAELWAMLDDPSCEVWDSRKER